MSVYAGVSPKSATFSPRPAIGEEPLYRYTLRRAWSNGLNVTFIGLNPSTADAKTDDPTTRRCVAFAKAWGFGSVTLVNLFALRSTDPDALLPAALSKEPTDRDAVIGPDNDAVLLAVVEAAALVIEAWGAHSAAKWRAPRVQSLLEGCRPCVLGRTKDGHPCHPLYLRGDARPVGGLLQTPARLPVDDTPPLALLDEPAMSPEERI